MSYEVSIYLNKEINKKNVGEGKSEELKMIKNKNNYNQWSK